MSLAESLSAIDAAYSGIVDVLFSTFLFGVPLGVYFIAAFIVRMVWKNVFDISSLNSDIRGVSKGKIPNIKE